MDPSSTRPAPSRYSGLAAGALTSAVVLLLAPALLPSSAFGQEGILGRTEFPHSGPEEAHAPFLEGILWLHSFEYDRAREAFLVAQEKAPDFALAYWG